MVTVYIILMVHCSQEMGLVADLVPDAHWVYTTSLTIAYTYCSYHLSKGEVSSNALNQLQMDDNQREMHYASCQNDWRDTLLSSSRSTSP